MRGVTTRNPDGTLTTILYNAKGQKVGKIKDHHFTGEEIEIAARQYRAERPDLFGDLILVDTAAESEAKNETAYRDGLKPVPGN